MSGSIRSRQPFDNVMSIRSGRRGGSGVGAAQWPLTAPGASAPQAAFRTRTGSSAAGGRATRIPSRTCRRQVNNSPGYTPCRAATSVTRTPGSFVSTAMRSFSSILQRRRRSRPVMTSIVPPVTDVKLRFMHSFKVISLRRPNLPRKTGQAGRSDVRCQEIGRV
jgi:hypothetical protein